MSQMIEAMESRTLLSASATVIVGDLATLKAEAATTKSSLISAGATAKADAVAIKASLKGVKLTKPQKQLLATLLRDEASTVAKEKAKISGLIQSGVAAGAHLEVTLRNLEHHPNSTAVKLSVGVALLKLQSVFSTSNVTAVENLASTLVGTVTTDLTALATAVPGSASADATAKTDLANYLTTFTTQTNTIEASITQLATDLV